MSCLSELSDPCKIINHIFCNADIYWKAAKSIKNARNAKNNHKLYCFTFVSPVNNAKITLKGERILEIIDNKCCIHWCSETEKCAGLTILNSTFLTDVLLSYYKAVHARNERKLFCKCFEIPKCLFPNVSKTKITLTGEQIISLHECSACCCKSSCC